MRIIFSIGMISWVTERNKIIHFSERVSLLSMFYIYDLGRSLTPSPVKEDFPGFGIKPCFCSSGPKSGRRRALMETCAGGLTGALVATTAGWAGSRDIIQAGKINEQLWQCLYTRAELIKTNPRECQLMTEWLSPRWTAISSLIKNIRRRKQQPNRAASSKGHIPLPNLSLQEWKE